MRCLQALILAISLAVVSTSAAAVGCSFTVAPSAPAFGAVAQLRKTPLNAQSTFTVTCDILTNLTEIVPVNLMVVVTMAMTTGASNDFTLRSAAGGPVYNYYVDSGRTQIWGDGTGGTFTKVHTFNFAVGQPTTQSMSFILYGTVASNPRGNAGATYTDTVNMTATYP